MISELKQRLIEAEVAYHKLMLGEKEVSITLSNFGSTSYNQTNKKDLEGYISDLKSQIARIQGKPTRRIIRVEF
ncbi:MAG: gpW family head-tail joining protein [Alphaproteobacteria bacterium]